MNAPATMLPSDVTLEQALLGLALIDRTQCERAQALLSPDDFADPFHQRVFTAMATLRDRGSIVSALTTKAALANDPAWAEIDANYLRSLSQSAPAVSDVNEYARALRDLSSRRALIRTAQDLVDEVNGTNDAPASGIATVFQSRLGAVAERSAQSSKPLSVSISDFLAVRMEPRAEILPPWLLAGTAAMVHAWRGVGKTLFGIGVASAVASGGQYLKWQACAPRRVLYIDGEMPGELMQERFRTAIASCPREA